MLVALGPIDAASAQIAGSVVFTTDYELRGLSLSNGLPAVSGTLSYDHASGLYAGLTATGVETTDSGVQFLGYLANSGYAHRINATMSFDAGLTYARVTIHEEQIYSANYTEIYAGLTARNISFHIYYSPDYLGFGESSFYFDCNAAVRLAEHLRLFGHAGLLALSDGHDESDLPSQQFDFRIGAAVDFDRFELQRSWAGPASRTQYLTAG